MTVRAGRRIGFALVAGAVALGLPAAAPAATPVGVEDDFFSPQRTTLTVGESDVEWIWDLDGTGGGQTESPHDVVSGDGLFDSGELTSSGAFSRRVSAGGFGYFCTIHAGMTGRLRVKPRVKAGGEGVAIRWAERGSNTGDRFDVQYRSDEPGGGWDDLVRDDSSRSAKVSYADPGRPSPIEIRVRSQRGRGAERQSGWSPVVRADPK